MASNLTPTSIRLVQVGLGQTHHYAGCAGRSNQVVPSLYIMHRHICVALLRPTYSSISPSPSHNITIFNEFQYNIHNEYLYSKNFALCSSRLAEWLRCWVTAIAVRDRFLVWDNFLKNLNFDDFTVNQSWKCYRHTHTLADVFYTHAKRNKLETVELFFSSSWWLTLCGVAANLFNSEIGRFHHCIIHHEHFNQLKIKTNKNNDGDQMII